VPAGLTLAAQLSKFPEIATCIVDQKNGPLELGQADGIACRTVEMFNAFGFAEQVLREACWVNETTFGVRPQRGRWHCARRMGQRYRAWPFGIPACHPQSGAGAWVLP
jgi:2-polyprenyl-6-methoxyphenol hydroxylase-like FAD-dependent oxidoreductase